VRARRRDAAAEESHRKNNNIARALCAGQNNNNNKPKKRCPPCIRRIYISYIIRYFAVETTMGQHTLSPFRVARLPYIYIYHVYYIIIITQYYNLTVRTHRPSCSSCIFVQTYILYIYIGKRIVRSKKGSPVYSKDFRDGTLIQHLHTAGRKIKTVHPPPREH